MSGHRHLERVLHVYIDNYNRQRPHRSLNLRPPAQADGRVLPIAGKIERHDRLGSLVDE
jgi:putative transposase